MFRAWTLKLSPTVWVKTPFVDKKFITPNFENYWHTNPTDFGAYQPSISIIYNNRILAWDPEWVAKSVACLEFLHFFRFVWKMQFGIICSCSYAVLQISVKAYLLVHSEFFLALFSLFPSINRSPSNSTNDGRFSVSSTKWMCIDRGP
jgi:hypothetical protein